MPSHCVELEWYLTINEEEETRERNFLPKKLFFQWFDTLVHWHLPIKSLYTRLPHPPLGGWNLPSVRRTRRGHSVGVCIYLRPLMRIWLCSTICLRVDNSTVPSSSNLTVYVAASYSTKMASDNTERNSSTKCLIPAKAWTTQLGLLNILANQVMAISYGLAAVW